MKFRTLLALGLILVLSTISFAAATGTLQVFSEEEDVYLYIDGYLKGKNAVKKEDAKIGEHYVKAVKGAKDGPLIFSTVAKVKAGEVTTVVVPMSGKQATPPAVSAPITPAPAAVAPPVAPTTPSAPAIPAPAAPAPVTAATQAATAAVAKKPGLPISVMDMSSFQAQELNLKAGVNVVESQLDSIKKDEIILSLDGNPIKNAAFYEKFLGFLEIGDSVALEVMGIDKSTRKVKLKIVDISSMPGPKSIESTPIPASTAEVTTPEVKPEVKTKKTEPVKPEKKETKSTDGFGDQKGFR